MGHINCNELELLLKVVTKLFKLIQIRYPVGIELEGYISFYCKFFLHNMRKLRFLSEEREY